MKKLLVYVLLVLIAVVLASLYGIIHNQISYTVSPEDFTKFKFRQFGFVDMPFPERVLASMVGFLASWWMGIPIGLLVGAAGFIHKGHRRMFKVSLWSFAVVVVFTLLFGCADCSTGIGAIRGHGSVAGDGSVTADASPWQQRIACWIRMVQYTNGWLVE